MNANKAPAGHRPADSDVQGPLAPQPLAQAADDDAEPSDLADFDVTRLDDEADWEVFLADDDERDPQPEAGDFWFDDSD